MGFVVCCVVVSFDVCMIVKKEEDLNSANPGAVEIRLYGRFPRDGKQADEVSQNSAQKKLPLLTDLTASAGVYLLYCEAAASYVLSV